MEKEFVPYELAVKLKELGFDEPCFGYYDNQRKEIDTTDIEVCERLSKYDTFIKAPTFSHTFRWFREKYNLQHELCSSIKNSWLITIMDTTSTTEYGVYNGKKWDCDDLDENIPHTYEEAELTCLKKLIEIVEQKIKD